MMFRAKIARFGHQNRQKEAVNIIDYGIYNLVSRETLHN